MLGDFAIRVLSLILFTSAVTNCYASSRRERRVHLSKNERPLLSGAFGRRSLTRRPIANGRGAKLRRRRTTSSTGKLSILRNQILRLTDRLHDNFRSLGEKYGLRIIPGSTSFLILPNNVSRSSAVGSILAPGGPARSPISPRAMWMSMDAETPDMDTDVDFVFAVSGDEKLLRRLNELDFAETISIGESGTGTDAKWKLERGEVIQTLWQLAQSK